MKTLPFATVLIVLLFLPSYKQQQQASHNFPVNSIAPTDSLPKVDTTTTKNRTNTDSLHRRKSILVRFYTDAVGKRVAELLGITAPK